MKLSELLNDEARAANAGIEVGGITADSRAVKRGDIFVAIAGAKADGVRFVDQAVAAGAAAIAAERRPKSLPDNVTFIETKNARRFLALSAAKFFPRQPTTI